MMKKWVANDYPGTKTAITEYNWGGQEHINGALAQADILGIFGREASHRHPLGTARSGHADSRPHGIRRSIATTTAAKSTFGDPAITSTSS